MLNSKPDIYEYLSYFQFNPKSRLNDITNVLGLLAELIVGKSFEQTYQADVY